MQEKIIIYQMLPRLFANTGGANRLGGTIDANGCGKFNRITERVLRDIRSTGFTHVWFTGVIDHAKQRNGEVSKGAAGSPYAVRDYYTVDADLAECAEARDAEFDALVARAHAAGLKVIIDFVPNHTARNYIGACTPQGERPLGSDDDATLFFAPSNNYYYLDAPLVLPCDGFNYAEPRAKATGNDVFNAAPSVHDWYETAKLNYGVHPFTGERAFDPVPDTWQKMTRVLLFWLARGVDGFRCDMAGMVPEEFWRYAIGRVRSERSEALFIAEIYEPHRYNAFLDCGFDLLYDKMGLYDALIRVMHGSDTSEITRAWQSVNAIKERMLSFTENHDEVRIGSINAQKGFAATAVAMLFTAGGSMIYFGQERYENGAGAQGFSGNDGRTTIFDYWSYEKLSDFKPNEEYARLIQLAASEPFKSGELYDLMWVNPESNDFDARNLYAFIRHTPQRAALVVVNFAAEPRRATIRLTDHVFDAIKAPINDVIVARGALEVSIDKYSYLCVDL